MKQSKTNAKLALRIKDWEETQARGASPNGKPHKYHKPGSRNREK